MENKFEWPKALNIKPEAKTQYEGMGITEARYDFMLDTIVSVVENAVGEFVYAGTIMQSTYQQIEPQTPEELLLVGYLVGITMETVYNYKRKQAEKVAAVLNQILGTAEMPHSM